MHYPEKRYDRIAKRHRIQGERELSLAAAEILGSAKSGRPTPECEGELRKAYTNVRGIWLWEQSPKRKEAHIELARIANAAGSLLKQIRASHRDAQYLIAHGWLFEDPFNQPTDKHAQEYFADLCERVSWLSEFFESNRRGLTRRGHPREQAKEWAVIHARALYRKFRGQRPTSTAGNDFHGLCGLIWQLATGEPDKLLERQVKYVLNPDFPMRRWRHKVRKSDDKV